jgi:GT2 family glycosyltransferase
LRPESGNGIESDHASYQVGSRPNTPIHYHVVMVSLGRRACEPSDEATVLPEGGRKGTVAAPVVSFVIPVKNDAERLDRCLTSIRTVAHGHPVELIVVDNGSSDASPETARRHGAIVLDVPEGRVSELRNRGAARASADILGFVDADHELGQGWVDAAVEDLHDARVGAVGARCDSPPGGTWVQHQYAALRGRTIGWADAEWMGAGNLAVRRSAFNALGGFDRALEACEDVDFCNRLRRSGWRLIADERLRNVHYGDPETLRRLFLSELWRGRDNVRVSLRGPLTLRAVPGVLIPVVDITCLAGAVVGFVLLPRGGGTLSAICLGAVLLIPLLRVARMLRQVDFRPRAVPPAYAVAFTYDVARALALVVRARHHRTTPSDDSR